MKARLILCMSVALLFAAMVPRSTQGAEEFVVDDDRAQCHHARFRSIQAAVDKARAGDVIKVCAGRYEEQVTVDKPLEIEGDGARLMKPVTTGDSAEAFDTADCFSATRPTFDPGTHVIVAPPLDAPSGVPTVLFDLQADDIKLEGFVLEGNDNAALPPSRAAVETSALGVGTRCRSGGKNHAAACAVAVEGSACSGQAGVAGPSLPANDSHWRNVGAGNRVSIGSYRIVGITSAAEAGGLTTGPNSLFNERTEP